MTMAEPDEVLQLGSDTEIEVWRSAYAGALAQGSKLPDRDADAAVRAYRLRSGKRRLEEVGGTGAPFPFGVRDTD